MQVELLGRVGEVFPALFRWTVAMKPVAVLLDRAVRRSVGRRLRVSGGGGGHYFGIRLIENGLGFAAELQI